MTANSIDTNLAICKMLGIATAGQNVVGVELKLHVGMPPTATITRLLTGADITAISQTFELRPIGQPETDPLDLEAMCSGAMRRINSFIDRLYTNHHVDIHLGFLHAARRLGLPATERVYDTDIACHPIGSEFPVCLAGAPA